MSPTQRRRTDARTRINHRKKASKAQKEFQGEQSGKASWAGVALREGNAPATN